MVDILGWVSGEKGSLKVMQKASTITVMFGGKTQFWSKYVVLRRVKTGEHTGGGFLKKLFYSSLYA